MSRPTIPLNEALANQMPLTDLQIAEFLQVSLRQVSRLVAAGLPSYKVGVSRRFDVHEVKQWLSQQRPALEKQSAGLHPKEQRENRLH